MRDISDLHFVVAGSYVADCIVNTDRIPDWDDNIIAKSVQLTPGGKGLNQAIALARLGAQVTALGVVAEDPAGLSILDALQTNGVDTSLMRHDAENGTAICVCFVGDHGQTAFIWRTPDSMAITPADVRRASDRLTSADGIIMTLEMPVPTAKEILSVAQGGVAKVALQPFPVPHGTHTLSFDSVDMIVPNLAESRTLAERLGISPSADTMMLSSQLHKKTGVPQVVITCGELGCVSFSEGSIQQFSAHHVDKVIDTTAASDVFTAYFAASVVAGSSIESAINSALTAAAYTIQRPGGYDSIPWTALGEAQ
ncbi:PfkB family carbohydrate kinase [Nocardia sp. NPDC051030]|uniref:PfkB family carbohydrate kinase n=1 Tax=Nocardia sp. NPDC051030 TaxID=3155162 RepID=UPI003432F59E